MPNRKKGLSSPPSGGAVAGPSSTPPDDDFEEINPLSFQDLWKDVAMPSARALLREMEHLPYFVSNLLGGSKILDDKSRAEYIKELLDWDSEQQLRYSIQTRRGMVFVPTLLDVLQSEGKSYREQLTECLNKLKESIALDTAHEQALMGDPEGKEARELEDLSDEQSESPRPRR